MTCPDENTLNELVEDLLDGPARARVEEHLDACDDCLHIVSAAARELPSPRDEAAGLDVIAFAEPLARGAAVGRYTVLEMLGQGGMGTVYLAHDPQLDRKVALKVLRASHNDQAAAGARMAREAKLMAKLAHPNIVTVFDAGESNGQTYIAMELVPGETMAGWLGEERSPQEILRRYVAAGRALAAAHTAGVVHRDFKPENVLIDAKGRVAVTDFGIASSSEPAAARNTPALADARLEGGLTRTGALLGTPRYMSPEQHEGRAVDAQSDQFSFAVAVYRALFGQPPFADASLEALRAALAKGELSPLGADAARRAPPRVRAALERALARDPASRFPSLAALLDELEAAEAEPPRPARRRTPGPVASGAALVFAAAAVAAAVALWGRAHDGRGATGAAADAARPPAAASTAAASGPTARTAVVVLPIRNATTDPRYDGALEATLQAALSPSKKVDAYGAEHLRAMSSAFEPGAELDVEAAARLLQARDPRPFVLVTGTVAGEDGRIGVTLDARDLEGRRSVMHAHEVGSDALSLATKLAVALRVALGDPPGAGEGASPALSPSLDAVHEYVNGMRVRNSGDYAGAATLFRRAIEADPPFAEAHAALGITLYDLQDHEAAAKEVALALRGGDRMGQRRRLGLLADFYAAENRQSESISASEQILSLWPGDLETEIALTATALDARQWALGIELARRAAKDHPAAVVARCNLLLALVATGAFEEAAREGDAALAAFPRLTRYGYAFIFAAHALLGARERAEGVLTKLAPVDAEFADEGRADLAIYEGRLDDATALLQGQIDLAVAQGKPENARTEYRSLAIVRLRRGDKKGAAAAARAGLGGGSVELQYTLASTLLAAGSDKPATELARRWAESAAPTARFHGKLLEGDLLVARGRARDATAPYRAALGVLDQWRGHERLGLAHLAAGAWEAAHAELTVAVERRGEAAVLETPSLQHLPPVLFGLARAAEGLKLPHAEDTYRAILARAPRAQGDPQVAEARARLAALTANAAAAR